MAPTYEFLFGFTNFFSWVGARIFGSHLCFFLDSPKVLGGWEPEFLAPTYSKNLVKNTLDFQNAKKNRECTKKYNLHSLRTFSAKVRFG